MVKLLEESDVDTIAESIDVELSLAEERQAAALGQYQEHDGSDLSDGGRVGSVDVHPTEGGRRVEKGRPSARRVWAWDGAESVIPLAWNPDGTSHDGGRRYLTKRHCLCCGISGFRGNQCKECDYNSCTKCNRGTDRSKIIPCFYLNKDDVPYAQRNYGNIPCFLQFCPRSGTQGFQTDEDMRLHARSRHRLEYAAMIEAQQANQKNEVEKLQEQINSLMAAALGNQQPIAEPTPIVQEAIVTDSRGRTPEKIQADKDRMAKVRAARKRK